MRASTVAELLLGGAMCAMASGCFSVPGPAAPVGVAQEIGADYRDVAVSRWVCKEWGSVVLAKTPNGHRLHLENLDWVMAPASEKNGDAVFGFGTSTGSLTLMYRDPVKPELVTTKTELGAGEVVFMASTKPGGPIVVRMGGDPPKEDTCRLAEGGGGS